MTKQELIKIGGKEWQQGSNHRVYLDSVLGLSYPFWLDLKTLKFQHKKGTMKRTEKAAAITNLENLIQARDLFNYKNEFEDCIDMILNNPHDYKLYVDSYLARREQA